MITFVKRGILTTIQDAGRKGFQRFGMPAAGAMDQFAMKLANVLVGNAPDTEVVEATIIGPSILFDEAEAFAVCGGDLEPCLDGQPIENNRAYIAKAGSLLELPMAKSGARAYIAFSGGLDAELKMGSRSTYMKAGIGGVQGRPVKDGDTLGLRAQKVELPHLPGRYVPAGFGVAYSSHPTVRVTLGPQDDLFSDKGKTDFCAGDYTLTQENDRMGFRFSGPDIESIPESDGNIISDGICFGAVQVTKGQPIVMMADRQTTGGYCKLGCVTSADLPLLAQLKTGDACRFRFVGVEEAQALYLAQLQLLDDLAKHLDTPAIAGAFATAHAAPRKTSLREFRVTVGVEVFDIQLEELD
ncbi:MAG: biotin-dependent carboxyltransferase [Spirochaetales bacterium]|nr:MAG: biotin-dependent carboxyltransferase [Spirochaetales bacterium]